MTAAVARRGELDAELAGETRRLRLGIAELERVEAATGRGIFALFDAAFGGALKLSEVRAILVNGLAGGGLEAKAARDLVDGWLSPARGFEALTIARAAIGVALAPDIAQDSEGGDPPGKAEGGGTPTGSR